MDWAKKIVLLGAKWALGTGIVLGALMWFGRGLVMDALVPATAFAVFIPAWAMSALSQPINAIAFLTDGAHWGTGDYRFLRNAMLAATTIGIIGVQLVDVSAPNALLLLWLAATAWAATRALFGWLRISPGIGKSPFLTESKKASL